MCVAFFIKNIFLGISKNNRNKWMFHSDGSQSAAMPISISNFHRSNVVTSQNAIHKKIISNPKQKCFIKFQNLKINLIFRRAQILWWTKRKGHRCQRHKIFCLIRIYFQNKCLRRARKFKVFLSFFARKWKFKIVSFGGVCRWRSKTSWLGEGKLAGKMKKSN